MTSRYAQAMRTLRFTEEQVDEIQRAVATRVASEDVGSETDVPLGTPVTPPRRSRAPKRLVTALVAAAVLLSAGGLAVATGNGRVDIPAVFEELIGVPAEQVEGAPGLSALLAAEPIASATSDGISVTLEAVFGDSHVISMLFTVEREDGKPLVCKSGCSKSEPNIWFEQFDFAFESELSPTGFMPASYGMSRFDLDSNDNALQFLVDAQGSLDMLEKAFKVDMSRLIDASTQNLLSEGSWSLEFVASPAHAQRTIEVKQVLELNGDTFTFESVTVSPFSISATIDTVGAPPASIEGGVLDDLLMLPLKVTMANGDTAMRYYPVSGGGASWTGGNHYDAYLSAYLDHIIDPAEAVSVTIGDLVIPLD